MSQPNVSIIPQSIGKAILKTFEIQVSVKTEIEEMSMDAEKIFSNKLDCLSSLVLSSTDYVGTLSLGFTQSTLLKIVERLTGEMKTTICAECADACMELLNIIYGSARKDINAAGFDFQPAIPTTVVGHELSPVVRNQGDTQMLYKCNSEVGPFSLVLNLRKKTKLGS